MEIWSRQLKVTWGAYAESWRVMTTGALQDKKYSLAWQLSRDLFQSQGRVTRMPSLAEMWLFVFLHHLYYIYPHYPQKWWWVYWEKNLKRGFYNTPTLLETVTHSLREIFVVTSPSLFHWYTHREEICTQTLPTPIQSVDSVFGALGSIGRCQGWRMQYGAYCKIR